MPSLHVLGTGVDLVENQRMEEVLQRWGGKFRSRVFVANEQAYCESKANPYRHYAGRFAVKEAVSKALGTGLGQYAGWLDIEVTKDVDTGAPSVLLTGRAKETVKRRHATDVLISLSHTRHYAIAHALLVADSDGPR